MIKRAGCEGHLDPALHRDVHGLLVLLKQKFPTILSPGTNRKHSHSNVIGKTRGRTDKKKKNVQSFLYLNGNSVKCLKKLWEGKDSLTSYSHLSPSNCWRAGWRCWHRVDDPAHNRTGGGSSAASSETQSHHQSTTAGLWASWTAAVCSPGPQRDNQHLLHLQHEQNGKFIFITCFIYNGNLKYVT